MSQLKKKGLLCGPLSFLRSSIKQERRPQKEESSVLSSPLSSFTSNGSCSSESTNTTRNSPKADTPSSASTGSRANSNALKLKVSARALFLCQNPQIKCLQGPESGIALALQQALLASPQDWAGHRVQCILLLHLGMESGDDEHFQHALEHAVVVMQASPDSPFPHVLATVAYVMLGQHNPALLACEHALRHNPKDLSAQVLRRLLAAESALREGLMGEVIRNCTDGLMLLGSSNKLSWALHESLFPIRTALQRLRSLALLQLGKFHDLRHKEDKAMQQRVLARERWALLGETLLLSPAAGGKSRAAQALQGLLEEEQDPADVRTRALLCLAEGHAALEENNPWGAARRVSDGLMLLDHAAGSTCVLPHFATMQPIARMLQELEARTCALLELS